ncbi:Restriction endonuclease S subunit [Snodgrassella alvi SCGC AB-598-J21]|uniref:Restriction endonuclease S subunit n=1 Tax=Snodgrassella alvi SCGC AB-598-J21 TaxID=1385367 RepID=A0A074V7H3_9NEIS|nr:Restriction endonuclease S subunit [Snodgrassella alvi SCGC AB-598-J21]
MGKLNDILEFKNGKAKKTNHGNIPIYGGNGVLGYCSDSNFENVLIIGRVGVYCGSVHIEESKCWISDNAIAGLPKKSSYNYYNYYLLKSLQLNNKQVGSSQPLLTQDILNNIGVQIEFDKEKQKRLVASLLAIDQKIELNNRINAELEAMAKTLYNYWFVQFDFPNEEGKPYKSSGGKMVYNSILKREIPEGWNVDRLQSYINFKRGISYKSNEISDIKGKEFLNLNSFSLKGEFKIEGTKYFIGKYNQESLVSSGGLVVAITDVTRNADIIGKAFIVPNIFEDGALISCDVVSITSERLNKFYLEQLFNSTYYHSYIKYYASGTLVLHLNLNGINWFNAILPPVGLLNQFEEFCKPILKKKAVILKENKQLIELRDWLLPMLMNGQVTVK